MRAALRISSAGVALAIILAGSAAQAGAPPAGPQTTPPEHRNPYAAFRFRLRAEGREVAGLSQAMISRPIAADGARRRLTGLRKFSSVSLKRGIIQDSSFETWLNGAVRPPQGGPSQMAATLDLELDTYDEGGRRIRRQPLRLCRSIGLKALPDLAAGAATLSVQSLTLACDASGPPLAP